MKPLQTLLTIDYAGDRCMNVEEGLESIGRRTIQVVTEEPAFIGRRKKGVLYYNSTSDEYFVYDSDHIKHTVYPVNLSNYPKYVLCQDEDEYDAIQNKDSQTLYLIPEE